MSSSLVYASSLSHHHRSPPSPLSSSSSPPLSSSGSRSPSPSSPSLSSPPPPPPTSIPPLRLPAFSMSVSSTEAVPTIHHASTAPVSARSLPDTSFRDGGNVEDGEEEFAILVGVRVRPITQREVSLAQAPRFRGKLDNVVRTQDSLVVLLDPDASGGSSLTGMERRHHERCFAFDYVFPESSSNEGIYQKSALSLIDSVLRGYNATCFCYGMTGAGKTYTMIGETHEDGTINPRIKGIYTLAVEDIFQRIDATTSVSLYSIRVSFLEIYNEKIKDLLTSESLSSDSKRGKSKNFLELQEDPVRGMVVHDLTEYEVKSVEQIHDIIVFGNSRRTMAPTGANVVSSRSHAILQIIVERRDRTRNVTESISVGKLSLIDLAGSERAASSDNRGIRMIEGANINRSLLALGNCINILSDRSKRGSFVPYRDSKLTRLLKDSLGGNTKTMMIANISPSCVCYEETLNTLKYAQRTKNIKKKVSRNTMSVDVHISQYKQIIATLREEISELKNKLAENSMNISAAPSPFASPPVQSNLHWKNSTAELGPINEEISRTEKQKQAVLALLQKHQRSLQEDSNDSESELEGYSRNLLSNFQEKIDLSQNLMDIEEQNAQNHVMIVRFKHVVDNMQQRLENADSQEICVYIRSQLSSVLEEVVTIARNTKENENIRAKILASLESNEEEKRELETALRSLKKQSQRSVLELQVAVHQLKVEKLEMQQKVLEMQREAVEKEKQREEQEEELQTLHHRIMELQRRLQEQDSIIQKHISSSTPDRDAYGKRSSEENVRGNRSNFVDATSRPSGLPSFHRLHSDVVEPDDESSMDTSGIHSIASTSTLSTQHGEEGSIKSSAPVSAGNPSSASLSKSSGQHHEMVKSPETYEFSDTARRQEQRLRVLEEEFAALKKRHDDKNRPERLAPKKPESSDVLAPATVLSPRSGPSSMHQVSNASVERSHIPNDPPLFGLKEPSHSAFRPVAVHPSNASSALSPRVESSSSSRDIPPFVVSDPPATTTPTTSSSSSALPVGKGLEHIPKTDAAFTVPSALTSVTGTSVSASTTLSSSSSSSSHAAAASAAALSLADLRSRISARKQLQERLFGRSKS